MKISARYSPLQIALHWLIALGIVSNYLLAGGMGEAFLQKLRGELVTLPIANFHVTLGIIIWVLVLIRVVLRLRLGAPAPKTGLMGRVAHWGHVLLYALILLMPFAGMGAWFGGRSAMGGIHMIMANFLMIVALGHALAALYHHFIVKDDILMRMLRPK